MLGFVFGPMAIVLGLRGFSGQGLPWSSKTRSMGRPARLIGGICIVIGAIMLLGGLLSLFGFAGRLGEPVGS